MADEKEKGQGKAETAGRPETAEELMLRAAELLERRGGTREKSNRRAAGTLREMVARLVERK